MSDRLSLDCGMLITTFRDDTRNVVHVRDQIMLHDRKRDADDVIFLKRAHRFGSPDR